MINKKCLLKKEKIVEFRDIKGFSFATIAKLAGVSKARIHQIYSGYSSKRIQNYYLRVLQRDKFKCQIGIKCKGIKFYSRSNLLVHHLDKNPKNNIMSNLLTVCRKCHGFIHKQ